jgi:hypothetical protein
MLKNDGRAKRGLNQASARFLLQETTMNQILQNAERLFEAQPPAPPAISGYEQERLAVLANLRRLRAERLARSTPPLSSK